MEEAIKNVWEEIQKQGFKHAVVFAVKDIEAEEIRTESIAEGDMTRLFASVLTILRENKASFDFFNAVVEEARKSKAKSDPNIN